MTSKQDFSPISIDELLAHLMSGAPLSNTPTEFCPPPAADKALATAQSLNKEFASLRASMAANDPQLKGIGDINSQARGSGARYNTGKTPMQLLPLTLVAASYDLAIKRDEGDDIDCAIIALDYLGAWQERLISQGGVSYLFHSMNALGDGWVECADGFQYGLKKYDEWNWCKGMTWSVPMACAARHLRAIIKGQVIDEESGLPHRGLVFCNLVMLATYELQQTYLEGDDRPALGLLSVAEAQS